jgi:hypothetical protein
MNEQNALESLREEVESLKDIQYVNKEVEKEVRNVVDAVLGSIDWYIHDLKEKRIAEIKGTEGGSC